MVESYPLQISLPNLNILLLVSGLQSKLGLLSHFPKTEIRTDAVLPDFPDQL